MESMLELVCFIIALTILFMVLPILVDVVITFVFVVLTLTFVSSLFVAIDQSAKARAARTANA